MKLGRRATKRDPNNVRMAAMLADQRFAALLPGTPMACTFSHLRNADGSIGLPITFGMFDNDRIGDCTCASFGHYDQAVSAHLGIPSTVDTAMVRRAYQSVGGWDPNDPSTDDGACNLDALKWFKRAGVIGGFVQLDEGNRKHLEIAIDLGMGVYVGADLPKSAQRQQVWDTAPAGQRDSSYDRGSWGGHAMFAVDYDADGVTFVTWGGLKRATWSWFYTYVDESYAAIHTALTKLGDRVAPNGYLVAQIAAAIVNVRDGAAG